MTDPLAHLSFFDEPLILDDSEWDFREADLTEDLIEAEFYGEDE